MIDIKKVLLQSAGTPENDAAVLLSAQATDVGVNKATRRLFVVANTPQQILGLGLLTITMW